MKKSIIIALIFAVICASFASADAYKDVNGLISRGLTEQNIQMIKACAAFHPYGVTW